MVAFLGTAEPVSVTEALGVILVLKAFADGCSALTGIGTLLGLMLVGLSVLIRREHVAPRGGVTVLTQLAAGSFGTGWAYHGTNIIVTVVLALAANTSFGGLPVLMSLLSGDNRLPHLFGLRAERPVHRYGVVALAVLAAILLIAVNTVTVRLIPLYAIGVFTGFTISQAGLVRHWHSQRTLHWMPRAALNGTGDGHGPFGIKGAVSQGVLTRALRYPERQSRIAQITPGRSHNQCVEPLQTPVADSGVLPEARTCPKCCRHSATV